MGFTSSHEDFDNITLISLFKEALGKSPDAISTQFNLSTQQNDSIHNTIYQARNSFNPVLNTDDVTDLPASYFVLSYIYGTNTITAIEINGQKSISDKFYQRNISFFDYLSMYETNITSNLGKSLLTIADEKQGLTEASFQEIHNINSSDSVNATVDQLKEIGVEFEKTTIQELVVLAPKLGEYALLFSEIELKILDLRVRLSVKIVGSKPFLYL